MTLRRRCGSATVARRLARALEADRPAFLRTGVRGSVLTFAFRAPNAASARATCDDLLACLAAAERVQGINPRPDPGRARSVRVPQ